MNVRLFVKRNASTVLTFLGGVGVVATTILAVKATPKALQLIEEEKNRRTDKILEGMSPNEDENCWQVVKLKPIEVAKVAWKPYIPAVLLGASSVACLIGANSVHARRQAALYSAYKLSETAFTEYRDKVLETVGEETEKEVRDKVAKDKVEKNPASKTEIYMTGKGESLFYDPISDRHFMSDIETIRKIVNDLNYAMGYGSEMYVSLSQLYDELGLKHTSISDNIGWNIRDGLIEPDFSSQIDEGKPCIVLDWLKVPSYNFDSNY